MILGDTSVLTDEQLMDGYDDIPYQDFFPVFILESDAANVAGVLDSIDGGAGFDLGAAALGPGASPFALGSTEKFVDINCFHRSLACEPLLRETAQQRGIVLTGKLERCTDYMRTKGRRGSVPRGPGARACKPLGRVHLDLCGPLVPSLGGNLYLFVAVDSASRWNTVYGLRRKSDALAATKRLLADVGRYDLGRIECFRVYNAPSGPAATSGDSSTTTASASSSPRLAFRRPRPSPAPVAAAAAPPAATPPPATTPSPAAAPAATSSPAATPPPATTPSPAPAPAPASPPAATPPSATTPPPAPKPSQPPSATSPSPSATPAPGQTSSAASPSPSATPDPDQPPSPPDPAMPPLKAHAMQGLRPGTKAEGMTDQRLPSRTRSGTRHSTGPVSMLDKNNLVSMLEARSAVDEERRELGGAEAGEPGGAGAGEQAGALAEVDPGAGGAGFPLAFATLLANREDTDATLRDQRPPEQRPDLPRCQASDLRVPKSYKEAMASMLAALACELNLDLCQFDIEQAFVRSELEEDVYMRLPQGCGALSGMIVKLGKSLYGLRQASRQWHAMLKSCLVELGFEQCMADACVFRLIEDGCIGLTLVVHVDDIFAVGEKERCDKFGADLNKPMPVKNLGELRWYSGCFYERNEETEHGVVGGKSVPMSSGVKLSDFHADEIETDYPFRELVGSLMWLATQTRSHIANAARAVARYCSSPKQVHWDAAIGILGYARKTSYFGISFQRGTVEGFSLQGYADADFASKAADRRSVSAGIVTYGGGAVSWFSRTQKCVTL
ncbi:unnamed protein product [Ectocarpus sp. CCAP 1310/34]|nr:unnamed protein product [Ectocarpus sp. CCAP 1310/34]